jgi:hypothetical protein
VLTMLFRHRRQKLKLSNGSAAGEDGEGTRFFRTLILIIAGHTAGRRHYSPSGPSGTGIGGIR